MEKTFHLNDILGLPDRFRRNLLNGIHGYKGAFLIGTKNINGYSNLAIFSQVIHIGANPPLVGVLFRPDSVERHTLENIRQTGEFSLNHVHSGIYKQAHQTSARYEMNQSEFIECGFKEEFIEPYKAPFVAECKIKCMLQFVEEHLFSINNTRLIIGKISLLRLPEDILSEDGFPSVEKADSVASCGLDSYFTGHKLGRLSYAKPGIEPHVFD